MELKEKFIKDLIGDELNGEIIIDNDSVTYWDEENEKMETIGTPISVLGKFLEHHEINWRRP